MAVTRSHSLSIGIVGLPNAGKSTLFNSITKNGVPAENFPFCTIDKNVGVVEVPDERLNMLANHYHAEKTVPSAITFVDIAGLVKGASEGEGLGNQFLAHIREVDAIIYVLRGFSSQTVTHVYERIDPWDDFQIVQTELILKDIETVKKKLSDVSKKARVSSGNEQERIKLLLERILKCLGEGIPAIDVEMDEDEREVVNDLWLLSIKPRIFLINMREGVKDDQQKELLDEFKKKANAKDFVIGVDVKIVGELTDMTTQEKEEYLSMLEEKPVMIEQLIQLAYKRLKLITFYTGSEKECNAWSIVEGATAKEAAGVIHTDLANGFITADIVNVEKMLEAGGYNEAREKGIVRNQGKGYLIQDGDYMIVYSH